MAERECGWWELAPEIRNMIYSEVVKEEKFIITKAEDVYRERTRQYTNRIICRRPDYAGLIVACKQVSIELQAFLYSNRIFRAHLCRFTDNNLPAPPPALGQIEILEIFLDQTRSPRATTLHWPKQERYYRTWYEALAGAIYQRKLCRIVISNIIMETFLTPDFQIIHVPSVTELLAAREKFIGFKQVVLELGEAPTHLQGDHSQSPGYQSAIGSIRDATYSGLAFEGLKALFASTLEAVLGPCIYYDRGNFRCLEFRPGDEVNPIKRNQSPFVNPESEDESEDEDDPEEQEHSEDNDD
ncbi:hypothetical protein BDR22DRAFT_892089 [Usnea florida]